MQIVDLAVEVSGVVERGYRRERQSDERSDEAHDRGDASPVSHRRRCTKDSAPLIACGAWRLATVGQGMGVAAA